MKKLNMKMYNNKTSNAGITLIALLITIIVLLILAGITLNMVMGDSGIFSKANKASEETNFNQAKETVQTALLSARMEYTLNKNLKGAEFINFIQKENKEITVEQKGAGGALEAWDMECNGWVFDILDLKIKGWSKGKINASIKNLKVTEEYQFATTAGNKAQVEFEVELEADLEGATVEVTPKTIGKGTVSGEYKDGKYTGTITTNGTDNPNGEYTYEIKITKDGTEKTMTAIARVEKFLSDPTIEIVEDSIKYDRFTVKVTSNYPQDAGVKYKYYVTNTSADFETVTTKEITGLDPKTEYTVKVEAYLSDEITYKSAETTVTTVTTKEKITVTADQIAANPTAYYGKKVVNYKANDSDTNTYRIFYVDTEGYFGEKNTIYLKADYLEEGFSMPGSYNSETTLVRTMNKKWAEGKKSESDTAIRGESEDSWSANEIAAARFCDPSNWTQFCNPDLANYAIAGPSIEMYVKSYTQTHDDITIVAKYATNSKRGGYCYEVNGEVKGSQGCETDADILDYSAEYNSMYCGRTTNGIGEKKGAWLFASPSLAGSSYGTLYLIVKGTDASLSYNASVTPTLSPLVSLKSGFIPQIEE